MTLAIDTASPPRYGVCRLNTRRPFTRYWHPWDQMQVGTAVRVETNDPRRRGSLLSAANRWARRNGRAWRFTSRARDGVIEIERVA